MNAKQFKDRLSNIIIINERHNKYLFKKYGNDNTVQVINELQEYLLNHGVNVIKIKYSCEFGGYYEALIGLDYQLYY